MQGNYIQVDLGDCVRGQYVPVIMICQGSEDSGKYDTKTNYDPHEWGICGVSDYPFPSCPSPLLL